MITELKKPFPVIVVSRNNAMGLAHWIDDQGIEHHKIWGVVTDAGEVWWVPNPEIRAQTNWTMGRLRQISDKHTTKHRHQK